MIKEILIGSSLAVVIFLAFLGYDVTPFIILGVLGGVLFFMADRKGLVKVAAPETNASSNFSFEDIGGQKSAKQEIKEAVDFVLCHDIVKKMGIRPLKGILLTGPPGTGKTLLAKAAAAYTDSVFLAAAGSDFIEMYAGVGAQRVRQLFKRARETARKEKKNCAIIFIDEIDVLASKRGSHASHLEYDQTLNQLLVEMDGIKTDEQIRTLLIAATNRSDVIDPAILRPGRFDRQVNVGLPDKEDRLQILQIHTRNKPLGADVDLNKIAQEAFGFSGAHLECLSNEAAIFAMRENSPVIKHRHLKEAIDKVIMGEKMGKKPSTDELYRVAVHETGHALVSEMIRPGSVSHLTIISRGGALGYMRQTPEDDKYLYTKEYLDGQIKICLAGAVAEELFLGNRSTGSANDFEQALNLSKRIVLTGMSNLGIVSSETMPRAVLNREMTRIVNELEVETRDYLQDMQTNMQAVIDLLLEKEHLSGEDLQAMLKKKPVACA